MDWPMREVLVVTLLAGVLIDCGCRSTDWRSEPPWWGRSPHEPSMTRTGEGVVSSAGGSGSGEADRPVATSDSIPVTQIIDLTFDIARAEFPMRGVQHSLKVWNHVDELRVDAVTAANLARNGLRIGAAAPEAWSAIQVILQAADAEVFRDQLIAPRGQPIALDLGQLEAGSSTFAYQPSGQLVGKTFTAGNRIVTIDYMYRPEREGMTDIHLSFEIRHDHGVMTWERRGGVIRQVPSIDRHGFEGLDASLSLARGEFLILGVDAEAASEYLIGRRFLTDRRGGEEIETLLFLTPQVIESVPAMDRATR
jgi:hypothetical protein